jgi:hypothetical protein
LRITWSWQIAGHPPFYPQIIVLNRPDDSFGACNERGPVKAVAPAREYSVGFPYDLDSLLPEEDGVSRSAIADLKVTC